MTLKRLVPVFVATALLAAGGTVMAQGQTTPATPATGTSGTGTAQPRPAATVPAVPEAVRKWEVEIHAGLVSVLDQRSGSGSLPTTGSLGQGLLSASTFYLGQGARLFNENQAARGTGSPIVPLDPVLLGSAIARERILLLGARFDRQLTERLGLEIAGEYRRGRLAFRPEALLGIEAARASVKVALEGALSQFPVPSAIASTSTLLDDQQANQLVATASLIVKLKKTGRVIPYVALGGGVILNDSTSPRAQLIGTYDIGNPAQLLYTDGVALNYEGEGDRAIVGVGGGGVKFLLSSRWGIRLDARANLYKNSTVNLVDLGASTRLQSTGQSFPILTSGTVQFSVLAPLSGTPASATPTFTGSGLQTHVVVSSGIFLRF